MRVDLDEAREIARAIMARLGVNFDLLSLEAQVQAVAGVCNVVEELERQGWRIVRPLRAVDVG